MLLSAHRIEELSFFWLALGVGLFLAHTQLHFIGASLHDNMQKRLAMDGSCVTDDVVGLYRGLLTQTSWQAAVHAV